jgi:membrane protein implicated in regulation of membrane protease activity
MFVSSSSLKKIESMEKNLKSLFFEISLLALAILIFAAIEPTKVEAYVGPGAGITAIGALWAVIATVFITLGGLLIWPIRSFLRRKKKKSEGEGELSKKPDEETIDGK